MVSWIAAEWSAQGPEMKWPLQGLPSAQVKGYSDKLLPTPTPWTSHRHHQSLASSFPCSSFQQLTGERGLLQMTSPNTWANDSSIFMVATIVVEPASVPALPEIGLRPWAHHVIQGDGTRARAKVGISWGWDCISTAQLPAHHLGILNVPVVIAHCSPLATMVDFHTPSTCGMGGVPVHQSQADIWKTHAVRGDEPHPPANTQSQLTPGSFPIPKATQWHRSVNKQLPDPPGRGSWHHRVQIPHLLDIFFSPSASIFFPHGLSQVTEYNSLFSTVGPWCLSIWM